MCATFAKNIVSFGCYINIHFILYYISVIFASMCVFLCFYVYVFRVSVFLQDNLKRPNVKVMM